MDLKKEDIGMTEWEKFFAYMAALITVAMLFHIARKLDEIAEILRKQQNSN